MLDCDKGLGDEVIVVRKVLHWDGRFQKSRQSYGVGFKLNAVETAEVKQEKLVEEFFTIGDGETKELQDYA